MSFLRSPNGHERHGPPASRWPDRPEELLSLVGPVLEQSEDPIERVLSLVREHLDMDVAFVSEFTDGRQVFRRVEGDGSSFGLEEGAGITLDQTYCRRMVDGRIPNVINDATCDPRVSDLPATLAAGIGSYVGVPVRFSDGRLYGTLCCLSHSPDPTLGRRDVKFIHVLARLLADQIEREEQEISRRRDRLDRIRRLMEVGALTVVLQPVIDLGSGAVVGLESLARSDTEPTGRPDVWLAEAGAVGLRAELEMVALRAALAQLDRIPPQAFLAVNISPETIGTAAFAETIERAPADRLVLEVTEHARVDDYDALNRTLHSLRARGTRLAVDDAGAGFASLRHILRLAPDLIKLDMALTRDIDSDRGRRALAASLIAFARQIDATLVAEGVETQAEVDALRSLGASYAQGYFLARPEPVREVG